MAEERREGYLEVRTTHFPSWRRMWIVLTTGTLSLATEPEQQTEVKLELKDCTIFEDPQAQTYKQFCFELRNADSFYLFSAKSEGEKEYWLLTINYCKNPQDLEDKKEEVIQKLEVFTNKLTMKKEALLKRKAKLDQQKKASMIGDYIVGKTIGEGSYGKVKMGTHHVSGRKVALKFVDRSSRTGHREVKILKLMHHPNIVKLYDVYDMPENGAICLVLELVEGGELYDLIVDSGHLTEEQTISIFRQIVSALEYMHSHLVIHRDLKPENILLDENENVKITDFGLSNLMSLNKFLSSHCGSMHYIPPEIHNRESYIGPEVDIWSLGVILFTMVCGYLPWKGDSLREQIDNLLMANYEVPKRVSKECQDLMSRLLVVNPKERATIPEIRKHPWVNRGFSEPPLSDLPLRRPLHVHEIDNEILVKMQELGFSIPEIVADLKVNAISKQTVIIYYLMVDNKKLVELSGDRYKKLPRASASVKKNLSLRNGGLDESDSSPPKINC